MFLLNIFNEGSRLTINDQATYSSSSSTRKRVKVTSGLSVALEEEKRFTWKIKNFDAIKTSPDRKLIRQQDFNFEVGESFGQPTKWRCYLWENSTTKTIGLYFNLILPTTSSPEQEGLPKLCVSFECRIIRPDGKTCVKGTVNNKWFPLERSDGWGFKSLIFNDEESFKQSLWKDGSIVIEVDFKLMVFQPPKKDLTEQVKIFEKQETEKLSMAMAQMLLEENNQGGSDLGKIRIVSKDKIEYLVNPAILAARSPFFKDFLSSENWKGSKSSSGGHAGLRMKDFSGKTVKVMLHYLYSGCLLEDWKDEDVIVELTWAAHKYQLDGLSEFLDKVVAEVPLQSKEEMGKLALLAKRLGMKNAEKELLEKLKKEAVDIDQLVLGNVGPLLG